MNVNAVEELATGHRYAQSELDDILVACYKSTKLFAQIFLPERFSLEFSDAHHRMFELMDSDERRIVIVAPRGVGKSTLWSLAYPAKLLCYRESNLIAMVSNTATQAERDSEDLKNELISNPLIAAAFGNMRPESREEAFSKEAWKTATLWRNNSIVHRGTLVIPRGWGQQIRGIRHFKFRFDKIVCDDIEGTESVMSEDQRLKLKRWFYADLLPAVQQAQILLPGEFPWKIVVVGTLLHEDSLLANLLNNPDWTSLHFELCNDSLKSNWSAFKSDEEIQRIHSEYERAGELDTFNREFRGIPMSAETQKFKPEYFRYYDESELTGKPGLESVVIVDPARTTEEHSNDTAIICWTFDQIGGLLYVRDLIVAKLEPDEIYKQCAEMATRFKATTIGIESTGLGEFLVQPFKNFLSHWGYSFEFVELKSRGMKNEKINRIASLIPYYRQGRIKHNRTCCRVLEEQLKAFPHSRRMDAMDAAAYIVEMLNLGDRYFSGSSQTTEADFHELENSYEPPIEPTDEKVSWSIE